MSSTRYTDEFKKEALKQIIDRGRPVQEVAERLGVTKVTLYDWLKKVRAKEKPQGELDLEKVHLENILLKAELKRVQE